MLKLIIVKSRCVWNHNEKKKISLERIIVDPNWASRVSASMGGAKYINNALGFFKWYTQEI